MTIAPANGMDLCYETFGDPAHPPLLLVMGLGAQMIVWDDAFCELLASRHFVIRFDNRDCGLSTHLDGVSVDVGALVAASAGLGPMPPVPYLLSDFAADAVGLLDALGLGSAHIVGASMGGMIAQTIAIEHPARVRSLTSIMSTTGEPDFSQPEPEALAVLLTPPADDRESRIAASVEAGRLLSSKRYFDADATRRRAAVQLDRAFYPEGTLRHMGAVVASGDRAAGLVDLRVPTLVIHGSEDPLIPPKGGVRTAELVPHADLLMIGHMGHDLPEPLWPLITGSILAHTGRADEERSRS